MNKNLLRRFALMGICGLILMAVAHAGTPVWTFAPVAGFPPAVFMTNSGETATIKYTVTNRSHKSHRLKMKPIKGIKSTGCTSRLAYNQSCTLTLTVNGNALNGFVTGGPVLCDQSNPLQCYQPSQANSLAIRIPQPSPVQQQIPLPGNPFAAITTPDGRYVFVSMSETYNGIAVIRQNATFASLEQMIPTCGLPRGLAMTRDGNYLLAAVANGPSCPSGGVQFINVPMAIAGDPSAALGTVPTDPSAIEVALSTDNSLVFVSNEYAHNVSVIDFKKALTSGQSASSIIGKIPADDAVVGLAVSHNDRFLYITSEVALPKRPFYNPNSCLNQAASSQTPCTIVYNHAPFGTLTVADIGKARTDPANSVVTVIPAGCGPTRVSLTNDDKIAWVSARAGNSLLAFDAQKIRIDPTRALLSTTPVGSNPDGIQTFFNRRFIAVANTNRFEGQCLGTGGTVSILDFTMALRGAGGAATVGFFNAGIFPRQWAASPNGRWLYLTEFLSNNLAIFPVSSLVQEVQ